MTAPDRSIAAVPPSGSRLPTGFPWRRALIALWLSAAAHLAILGLIRLNPAPARQQTGSLQVRLERAPRTESPAPLPAPFPSPELSVPRPQPQARPSAASEPVAEPEPSSMPHLDLPQLADTTYYEIVALDEIPQPLSAIDLADPEAGSPNPHVGHVILQLKLEANGLVSEAKVIESTLPPEYEALVLNAYGKARYSPGRKGGRAVRAQIRIVWGVKPPEASSR